MSRRNLRIGALIAVLSLSALVLIIKALTAVPYVSPAPPAKPVEAGPPGGPLALPAYETPTRVPTAYRPWSLSMAGLYGSAQAYTGIEGLEYFNLTRSPAQFNQAARTYTGNNNALAGAVQVTSPLSQTAPGAWTFTAALDEADIQDRFTMTLPCYMEFPNLGAVVVDGTVTAARCGPIGTGICRFDVAVRRVGGQACP
jgi:hypothetical protein